jgi:hypothetical protein
MSEIMSRIFQVSRCKPICGQAFNANNIFAPHNQLFRIIGHCSQYGHAVIWSALHKFPDMLPFALLRLLIISSTGNPSSPIMAMVDHHVLPSGASY